jgi:hypothetical protein
MSAIAPEEFSGTIEYRPRFVVYAGSMHNKIMKLTTIALAAGLALFGTFALAKTDRSVVKQHRGTVSRIQLHPNYGNPAGPAGGARMNYAVPGWTDEQTRDWIDSASGPKG